MVVASPHSARAALAWADRLYAQVFPVPRDNPANAAQDAYDAYRQVLRRYPSSRANVGIGNCLLFLGHYRGAAVAYGRSPLAAEARRRESVAHDAERLTPNRRVIQVEPATGFPNRWIALAASVRPGNVNERSPNELTLVGAFVVQIDAQGIRCIGAERMIVPPDSHDSDGDPSRSVVLYRSRLTPKGAPVVIAYADWPGADNDTNVQRIFRVTASGLSPLAEFYGKAPTTVDAPTGSHGLLLTVTATWKVWWPDIYEWNGTRFVFANRRSPNLYHLAQWRGLASRLPSLYTAWLKLASVEMIHGRTRSALAALRRAERACRIAARFGVERSDYYTAGFHGDDAVNLREIRQRIRWIRRGDYDHALLYRPYDFDLQVPPYRLGTARTVQEKRGEL